MNSLHIAYDVSPDAGKVVFTGTGKGGSDLYLLTLRDMQVTRLTETSDFEMVPSFSPDGAFIAYALYHEQQGSSIYIRSLDGKITRRVTFDNKVMDSSPRFSPDGKQIAFVRAHRLRDYSLGGTVWSEYDLYLVNVDGTQLRRVTNKKYYGVGAPWWLGEKELLSDTTEYIENAPPGKQTRFYVFSLDIQNPSQEKKVIHIAASSPALSPDGKWIAYISDAAKAYDYEVWVQRTDGKARRQVTITGAYNDDPRWAGNDTLFFLRDDKRNGCYGLWRVRLDGTGSEQTAGYALFAKPLEWKDNSLL